MQTCLDGLVCPQHTTKVQSLGPTVSSSSSQAPLRTSVLLKRRQTCAQEAVGKCSDGFTLQCRLVSGKELGIFCVSYPSTSPGRLWLRVFRGLRPSAQGSLLTLETSSMAMSPSPMGCPFQLQPHHFLSFLQPQGPLYLH